MAQAEALARRNWHTAARECRRIRRERSRDTRPACRRQIPPPRRGQRPEVGHRGEEPVQRAGKIDRAGQESEEQRAPREQRHRYPARRNPPLTTLRVANDRDDKRRQRKPGTGRMAEFRKAEREKRAREKC